MPKNSALRNVLESAAEAKRPEWRKAVAVFEPYRSLGERLQKSDPSSDVGSEILDLYASAFSKAKATQFESAMEELEKATKLAKTSQNALDQQKQTIASETAADQEKQLAAFAIVVKVDDAEYGFDTDTDAKYFYLANTVDDQGGLVESETLAKMKSVLRECIDRKLTLEKAGASIDEIIQASFKNVPEAFWPDSIVKEVVLYKAATAQIESEKALAEAEADEVLKSGAEKAETLSGIITKGKALNKWAGEKFGESSEEFKQFSETMKLVATGLAIGTDLIGATFSGVSALDKGSNAAEPEDNPVQAKIDEFERNKAIVTCVNTLVGLGLSEVSDFVPVLGAVMKGKDVLLEAAKAAYYFKNVLDLKKLSKGAKIDPRSAALLPLARLAKEQKIAMSESALKAISSALETAGKATELAAVAAPVGLALDASGKVLSFGSKVVIAGINWSDAKNAADLIKQAAGPPPLRRAQIEVMKHSSMYAKVAIVHLAMKEHDPWAIGHLENMGLERQDLDHPATSSKLIRQYMALKAGGLLGSEQGEDQLEDGTLMKLAKGAGGGIASATEWVRDKIVGRDTSIPYDSNWRAGIADLRLEAWEEVRTQAIAAGWYDTRPKLEGVLTTYGQAQTEYNHNNDNLEKQIEVATEFEAALQLTIAEINKIPGIANDRKTNHAGMIAFTFQWGKLAGGRLDALRKSRVTLIDAKKFPGLEGEELELARQRFMDEAIENAKREQVAKARLRQTEVAKLWDAHKIKTPWVKCTLADFPGKIENGIFTFGATGAMDFHETEVAELAVSVAEMRTTVLDRIGRELLASPSDQLETNFTASAVTADRLVIEWLRLKCEQLYHNKMKLADKTEDPLWGPTNDDIVLEWKQWRKVITAAKSGGWDQESNTGFTDLLKEYQKSRLGFETENEKETPNPTKLGQLQGLVLGSLDQFENKLKSFRPVTKQKFLHPGLIVYRDGMLELCLAARIQCSQLNLAK